MEAPLGALGAPRLLDLCTPIVVLLDIGLKSRPQMAIQTSSKGANKCRLLAPRKSPKGSFYSIYTSKIYEKARRYRGYCDS